MNQFMEQYRQLLDAFADGKHMVLSTSADEHVTSRMMSIVEIDGCFYFQTDRDFRKYHQLMKNPRAALCAENIQIEGLCKEIGKPKDHEDFCEAYQRCFRGSYDRYSLLDQERLFCLRPTYIERWRYIGGKPYMEMFDVDRGDYKLIEYMPEEDETKGE